MLPGLGPLASILPPGHRELPVKVREQDPLRLGFGRHGVGVGQLWLHAKCHYCGGGKSAEGP